MAKKKSNNKSKLLIFLALPLLNMGYQLISPYMDETKKMQEEAKKLSDQVKQVKTDSAMFSDGWEAKHAASERELLQFLPEKIVPSEILRYFATNFEKDHAGVQFTSLIPSSPVVSGFNADPDNKNIKARVSKLQIKGKMPAQHILQYIEYVEKYPGLSRVGEVNITAQNDTKTSNLDFEMAVELFLVPKDWLPKEDPKKSEEAPREVAATPAATGWDWFEVKAIEEEAKKSTEEEKDDGEEETPKPKPPPKPPTLRITQFAGTSIVIGESLFEEGDSYRGWQIVKIDSKTKSVIIKNGNRIFKVVAK